MTNSHQRRHSITWQCALWALPVHKAGMQAILHHTSASVSCAISYTALRPRRGLLAVLRATMAYRTVRSSTCRVCVLGSDIHRRARLTSSSLGPDRLSIRVGGKAASVNYNA